MCATPTRHGVDTLWPYESSTKFTTLTMHCNKKRINKF
jgi:hypothetical protein